MAKITVRDIAHMKANGEKIPMVTAYDYTAARLADQAGIPLLLVGDSLGMVVLGYDSTIQVTMEDVLHHLKAVVRGADRAMVVADLPFMTYQISTEQALTNSARLIQEGGAHSVKLEGGEQVAATVERIVQCGIPVMGHIGLTPQSINALGGYRVQGRGRLGAAQLLQDARAPARSRRLRRGVGAGSHAASRTDLPAAQHTHHRDRRRPRVRWAGAGITRHAGPIHRVRSQARKAIRQAGRVDARSPRPVRPRGWEGTFPTDKESFTMDESILEELAVLP